MSRRETATKLLAQATILKLLKEADAGTREDAKATEFDEVGVREPGKIGDTTIGTVRLDKGSVTARVTDPRAFLAWVQERYPHNVETVQRVIPSFEAVIVKAVKEGGWVDPATGELLDPPGVEVSEGDPKLVVTPSKEAPKAVVEALGSAAVLLGLGPRKELEQ